MKPSRVLYFENGIGYGGAVVYLRHLVRNLDRSRYEPIVVTTLDDAPYREIAAEATWEVLPDCSVNVNRLRAAVEGTRWTTKSPALKFLAAQAIARTDDVANLLPYLVRLVALIRRTRPDIIHTNNEPFCNRGAILAGRVLRVPVVSHVRGSVRVSRLTRWLCRVPDRFVAVSKWLVDGLHASGVPDAKVSVIYDGLPLQNASLGERGTSFREALGVPLDAFVVALVGLLIAWKGQRDFIEAARLLRREIPGLRMLVVGGTPRGCEAYEAELKQAVTEAGIDDIVKFTGHMSDMAFVYSGVDVVVSASTAPEPLGMVMAEAMAKGRPLVAPAHGGAAEIVEHGRSGLLFAPGDPLDLAAQIRAYFDNPGLRAAVVAEAREVALSTFGVEQQARRVEAVYDACLSGRNRGPKGRGKQL